MSRTWAAVMSSRPRPRRWSPEAESLLTGRGRAGRRLAAATVATTSDGHFAGDDVEEVLREACGSGTTWLLAQTHVRPQPGGKEIGQSRVGLAHLLGAGRRLRPGDDLGVIVVDELDGTGCIPLLDGLHEFKPHAVQSARHPQPAL